ncbi:hypothetical protein [Paracoccus sp. (in: a-proteobacteria)]|uniref:hypothetical protein n=1 Tax=Paracoccus sp. TaxID=267 RepID=UPI003A83EB87
MRTGAVTIAGMVMLSLAACEPTTGSNTGEGGTVVAAGDTEMRVAPGETVHGLAGGPMTMLRVTRADKKTTTQQDEASARAAYAGYCSDKGGVGAGGEGYFSQFGGVAAWKFGACGA